MRRYRKFLLVAAAAAVLVAVSLALPVTEWFTVGLAWIQAHREFAWMVFIGLYIVSAVMMVPGSILTVAAGFIFGLPIGVLLVSVSSVLGATAAFLLGRFLARDWVAERTAGWQRFSALDRAVEKRGFLVVLLIRLSPLIPFNLLNYALGLTRVRLRHYVLGSWLGMFPATIVYVWAGTLAQTLAAAAAGEVETGAAGHLLLTLGLIATLTVTVVVTRLAGRELNRQLETRDEQTAAP